VPKPFSNIVSAPTKKSKKKNEKKNNPKKKKGRAKEPGFLLTKREETAIPANIKWGEMIRDRSRRSGAGSR